MNGAMPRARKFGKCQIPTAQSEATSFGFLLSHTRDENRPAIALLWCFRRNLITERPDWPSFVH